MYKRMKTQDHLQGLKVLIAAAWTPLPPQRNVIKQNILISHLGARSLRFARSTEMEMAIPRSASCEA